MVRGTATLGDGLPATATTATIKGGLWVERGLRAGSAAIAGQCSGETGVPCLHGVPQAPS